MSELRAIRSGEIYNIIEYEDCYRTDDLYYTKVEVDKVIAEKDAENRRIKRALWLARAERAKDRAIMCDDFAYLGDTERNISMTLARTWMKCRLLIPSEWSKVWKKVERKCLKKAEEYR